MCHFLQRECDELCANAITQHLLSTSVSVAFWNLYLIMWIFVFHDIYETLEQPTAHCMCNITLILCLGIYVWLYSLYSESFQTPSTSLKIESLPSPQILLERPFQFLLGLRQKSSCLNCQIANWKCWQCSGCATLIYLKTKK